MADHLAPLAPQLEFDASSGRLFHCSDAGVTTMFAWPVIQAFRRFAPNRSCAACSPEFVILPIQRADHGAGLAAVPDVPGLDAHTRGAVEAFCATIPVHIRRVVARFPERQWDVLAWVARAGLPGEELLASNAALAFALANAGDLLGPSASARCTATERLLLPYRRQRDILARLGFPKGEHVRKILRKVLPPVVSVHALTQLRVQLPRRDVAERLVQASVIGSNVMTMVESGTIEHISIAALRRFANADAAIAADSVSRQVSEAVRVWGTARVDVTTPPAPVGRARPARATPAPGMPAAGFDKRTDFPPAPFPGTDAIVPILTRAQLSEEGRRQQNCVADCAPQMARGRLAIYRVLSPERCTLSLKLRRDRWVIDQLKTASNKEPRIDTIGAVREWIAQCEPASRAGKGAGQP